MTTKKFIDYQWHDAKLTSVIIDRTQPGEKDDIKLIISWPESSDKNEFVFKDCYAFHANMYFGVMATENILDAECIASDHIIEDLRRKWANLDVDLSMLKCFHFTTNSTGGKFDIYALSFECLT